MSLEAETQLGTYKIVGPLGAGGMGEVYRATDTKLDREVALKVLPDVMAHDPERVARFQREARLLASLNHSQIAAIYGFEEAADKCFLVLELVEGPTLADRLADGPLMVEESLDVARQIAEALEVAHDKGIIHRDLKPANVKITPDGQVKVLDFGLAKALADENTEADPGTSPTITRNFTQPGVILGTAAYMSPEQARGHAVDKRTDIWSFGCVLYECLTGDSVFLGETVTDSIGAVLHKQPDWEKLPPNTPPTIQLLLRRCLAKDRKRRLRDIGDVRIELEAAIADPTSSALGLASAAIAAEGRVPLLSSRVVAALSLAILLTASITIGIAWSLWPPPTPPAPVERFGVVLPHRESEVFRRRIQNFTVSQDGELLCYVVEEADQAALSLFLRRRDQLQPSRLTTERIPYLAHPTFSPDGKWLTYELGGWQDALMKVSIQGGPPTKLCDLTEFRGGLNWSSDGRILISDINKPGHFFWVGENGGTPEEILLPDSKDKYIDWLHPLPDGQAVLYESSDSLSSRPNRSIDVYSFQTKKSRQLVENGRFPYYARSGHLLFLRESTLMAASFDARTLERTSEPVPVLEGIRNSNTSGARFHVTDEGTLFYCLGDDGNEWTPQTIYRYALDGDGRPEPFSSQTGHFGEFDISPDGRFMAITVFNLDERNGDDDRSRIHVLDTKRDVITVLNSEPGRQRHPFFSPDGEWVYYVNNVDGEDNSTIHRHRTDRSGQAQLVYEAPADTLFTCAFSPDGKELYFSERAENDGSTGMDIFVLHLDESGEEASKNIWYGGPRLQIDPVVSPNGRWVAFNSHHEGARENPSRVYVKSRVGEGGVYPVSSHGGFRSQWSPDGSMLYFLARDKRKIRLTAAEVNSGHQPSLDEESDRFEIGQIKTILEPDEPFFFYRITPDGKNVLVIQDAKPQGEDGEQSQEESVDDLAVIQVVRNFFTELERLAPTD